MFQAQVNAMINVDAVIFDKDGTLLDFDAFWVAVSVKALENVLQELRVKKDLLLEILESLGVHNGVTDVNGILCQGTYQQISEIVYKVLINNDYQVPFTSVAEMVVSSYEQNVGQGEIKPTCADLNDVLKTLKTWNKRLAVVTTDNAPITQKCLKGLGIEGMFDRIYTDNGKNPPKPNAYSALEFCKEYNIKKECVVMVGDTLTDVEFARNAGIRMIGFAKDNKNKEFLLKHTNIVISELSQLLDMIK